MGHPVSVYLELLFIYDIEELQGLKYRFEMLDMFALLQSEVAYLHMPVLFRKWGQ